MVTYPRDRFAYSTPFTRSPLRLPKGRMIVWSVVNIEEWEITRPMARQLSQPPMGQTPIPDMPNWTWYEYGMRVGFWRLMRALAKARRHPDHVDQRKSLRDLSGSGGGGARRRLGIHGAFLGPDADPADRGPARRDPAIDRGDRSFHRQEADRLARPGPRPDLRDARPRRRSGLTWFGDWVLDDQPLWVKTAHGPILSIPYSAEINDITLMVSHHHESEVLLTRTRDAFDRLYEESAKSTRILAIGVHPYVTGAAHRIKYFEELYAYINRHDVVHWTGQQIHDWYVGQVPKPR